MMFFILWLPSPSDSEVVVLSVEEEKGLQVRRMMSRLPLRLRVSI